MMLQRARLYHLSDFIIHESVLFVKHKKTSGLPEILLSVCPDAVMRGIFKQMEKLFIKNILWEIFIDLNLKKEDASTQLDRHTLCKSGINYFLFCPFLLIIPVIIVIETNVSAWMKQIIITIPIDSSMKLNISFIITNDRVKTPNIYP